MIVIDYWIFPELFQWIHVMFMSHSSCACSFEFRAVQLEDEASFTTSSPWALLQSSSISCVIISCVPECVLSFAAVLLFQDIRQNGENAVRLRINCKKINILCVHLFLKSFYCKLHDFKVNWLLQVCMCNWDRYFFLLCHACICSTWQLFLLNRECLCNMVIIMLTIVLGILM